MIYVLIYTKYFGVYQDKKKTERNTNKFVFNLLSIYNINFKNGQHLIIVYRTTVDSFII